MSCSFKNEWTLNKNIVGDLFEVYNMFKHDAFLFIAGEQNICRFTARPNCNVPITNSQTARPGPGARTMRKCGRPGDLFKFEHFFVISSYCMVIVWLLYVKTKKVCVCAFVFLLAFSAIQHICTTLYISNIVLTYASYIYIHISYDWHTGSSVWHGSTVNAMVAFAAFGSHRWT